MSKLKEMALRLLLIIVSAIIVLGPTVMGIMSALCIVPFLGPFMAVAIGSLVSSGLYLLVFSCCGKDRLI